MRPPCGNQSEANQIRLRLVLAMITMITNTMATITMTTITTRTIAMTTTTVAMTNITLITSYYYYNDYLQWTDLPGLSAMRGNETDTKHHTTLYIDRCASMKEINTMFAGTLMLDNALLAKRKENYRTRRRKWFAVQPYHASDLFIVWKAHKVAIIDR